MGHGVLCVMMAGVQTMLVLCADNLVTVDMRHCPITNTTLGEELVNLLVMQVSHRSRNPMDDNSVCVYDII